MSQETPGSVLVCVTVQPSCHRLIVAGKSLAEQYGVPLRVVSVLPKRLVSPKTADALQTLYNISGKLGAEMTVFFNDEVALTVAVHARQSDVIHLVSGMPEADSNAFVETIRELLPDIPLSLVDQDGQMVTFPALVSSVSPSQKRD